MDATTHRLGRRRLFAPFQVCVVGLRTVAARCAGLRSDERGNVMLLSGMMVFAAVVLALFNLNTGKAIRNRIISQNAADSAADANALWEARGCNILQHLNNLHYRINEIAFVAENIAAAGCVVSVPLRAAPEATLPISWTSAWAAAVAAEVVACSACTMVPVVEKAQEGLDLAITTIQEFVRWGIPIYAAFRANIAAKQSGGDVAPGKDALESLLSRLGVPIRLPSLPSPPIYAIPMRFNYPPLTDDPLGVEMKTGTKLPWKTPEAWNGYVKGAYTLGKEACSLPGPGWPAAGVFRALMPQPGSISEYGWEDKYANGNPGYTSWIAGKSKEFERAGLTNSVWLTSNRSIDPGSLNDRWLQQKLAGDPNAIGGDLDRFYDGNYIDQNRTLEIPGLIAIASSQVEGEPVVDKGTADAEGKIISVYFPIGDGYSGERIFIYH